MDSDAGKLFVGGLSWETTEEKLTDYFKAYGDVAESVIMKDKATGRGRGFGFVAFVTPSVADRVLLEKHTIDGKLVQAKKAIPREEQQNMSKNSYLGNSTPVGQIRTKKIFVGGLAPTVTEDDFRQYFQEFGSITDVVVMYDHATQRHRGFGFITFDSEDAVDRVVQKPFHQLKEKMVEVKRAVPKELSMSPSGRAPSNNFSANSGGGAPYNAAYGQNYGSRPGSGYGGGIDSRYVSAPPAIRGAFPMYGPGGYPSNGYGPAGGYPPTMNGGFGAVSGYGTMGPYGGGYVNPPGAYGSNGVTTGGYGGAPPSAPRSPWGNAGFVSGGGPTTGYAANNGGGMPNYSTTVQTAPANSGYGYRDNDAGYGNQGSNAYGGSGPVPSAGYVESYGTTMQPDSSWRPAPIAASAPSGVASGYGMNGGTATENGPSNYGGGYTAAGVAVQM